MAINPESLDPRSIIHYEGTEQVIDAFPHGEIPNDDFSVRKHPNQLVIPNAFPPVLNSEVSHIYKLHELWAERLQRLKNLRIITAGLVLGVLGALALVGFEKGKDYINDIDRVDASSSYNPHWGELVEPISSRNLMTDQYGGVKAIAIMDSSATDVIGITAPGCEVYVTKARGDAYAVVPGVDEENLPLEVIDGVANRPWFFGEFPLYDLQEGGKFKRRLDAEGNGVFASGFIKGVHLAVYAPPRDDCEAQVENK